MADFCTNCVKEWFDAPSEGGPCKPDIDVEAIFKTLEPENYVSELCEGCGLIAIGNIDGKLKVRYIDKEGWQDYKVKP